MDELAVAAGDEVSRWSWEENKLFGVALAVVEEEDPNRWEVVAAMVGGNKSAEVYSHYVIILFGNYHIGNLDYKLTDDAAQFYNSSTRSISWTMKITTCWFNWTVTDQWVRTTILESYRIPVLIKLPNLNNAAGMGKLIGFFSRASLLLK